MRIAVLSDIHGNSFALEAVLADIGRQSVDSMVNLGDILSGGVDPVATMTILREHPMPTVRGNHERQVLTPPRSALGLSDGLAFDTISADDTAWIASLPLSLSPAAGVLAFHATPTDDATYLLSTVEPSGSRPATMAEVLDRLGADATGWNLLLCGHTHLAHQLRLPSGTLVVNPGSVGWPAYDDDAPYVHTMESGTPHARYAIVDDSSGDWVAELRAVDYDWDAAAAVARANGRVDVADALLTGRMPASPPNPA
ncbi:MAG: metallophosphoesterase [Glaciihabitans sp.]|nr:metallophosphoesterase [Glaciihabitans sp.]